MRLRTPSRTDLPAPRPLGPGGGGRFLLLPSLLLFVGAAAPGARPSDPRGPSTENRVDYVIEARLEGEGDGQRLLGKLRATWTNGSTDTVDDLWFHLYLNAFSNNRSTHLAESEDGGRGPLFEDGWGWSRVTAARVGDPGASATEDVFHTFEYRRPDDEREEDRTVFRLALPHPVPPGGSIVVELEWESQLPRVRRRTGVKGDFLLVAQWFPKLGVYESGRGWNCHQFHRNTEFFSDYGTYDVTLNLPARYAGHVGATGSKTNDVINGERLEVRFAAPSSVDRLNADRTGKRALVHDFTWTADPSFESYTATFRYQTWAENYPEEVAKAQRILGEGADVTLRNVDVTVLYPPAHAGQASRYFEATCAALFFYGLWFGEYPYRHITVVDPAWGAGGAGGMEYPTLFTCGTSLLATEDMHRPEGVTVHECGHQFWQGLVGNNEFEAAFLDEGINSYADSEVMHRVYGDRRSTTIYARIPVDGVSVGGRFHGRDEASGLVETVANVLRARSIPMPVIPDLQPLYPSGFLDYWCDQPRFTFVREFTDPRWEDRAGYLRNPGTDPINTPGWKFADRVSYRINSYQGPAVALRTLSSVIGEDAFRRGMRHHATTWRYRHPYPADFYATFQEGAGVDVEWFFHELFESIGTVDWSVEVSQARRDPPRGLFQGEEGRFMAPPAENVAGEESPEAPWRISVLLRRTGELRLDLPYRLVFEDGTVEEGVWTRDEQGRSNWKRLASERPRKLKAVLLDPDRGIYLDQDMSNNQWYDETDERAPWRWGERVLAQYQRSFHWIAGIGG